MDKYLYFNNESEIILCFNTLEELKTQYLKICSKGFVESGQAESEFYDEMKDGYLIINHYTGRIDFFIIEEKIPNIINDLGNKDKKSDNEFKEMFRDIKAEKKILKIFRKKLKIKN